MSKYHTPYMELIFPLFVIRNVEKKLRCALKVDETAIKMLNFSVSILVKHRNTANGKKQIQRSYLFVRARRLQMQVT